MQQEIISWFGSGDTGLSSETIAIAGTGAGAPERGWSYPHDPSDFSRCARLLRQIPELRKPAFDRLRNEGGEVWRALIDRWDDIHETMKNEAGIDWEKQQRAEKTYGLMCHIINAARSGLPHTGQPVTEKE